MTGTIAFRAASAADDERLRALLGSVGLPTADVSCDAQEYLLALDGDRLVGAVGLELVGGDGLARSLAVAPGWRGRGLARELNERLLAHARLRGAQALYLLTTTAEAFAARAGFERIPRSEVPPGILGLPQFRSLCPSSAVCMRRSVG